MKPLRELLVPILFLVEGAFWLAIVATGGGPFLLLAALTGVLSAIFLFAAPSNQITRPLAGASALFALSLTLYQVYQATSLLGSNLTSLGITSGAAFAVIAVVSAYLELATLSMGSEA